MEAILSANTHPHTYIRAHTHALETCRLPEHRVRCIYTVFRANCMPFHASSMNTLGKYVCVCFATDLFMASGRWKLHLHTLAPPTASHSAICSAE